MRTITLFFFVALMLFYSYSQSQTIHKLSLEDATSLALQNAEELKNLKLDVDIQAANNKEITGTTYPQIAASGQGSYYTNLPQIQFPSSNFSIYEVLQDEGVKDGSGNTISTESATFGAQPVSFVAPLNFQFGITVNQLLFQPDVFIAIKAREAVLQYNRDNLKVSEVNVREAVQKAYYNVLIAQEQMNVLIATAERLEKLTAEMNQMFQAGFSEKLDVDRLQVTVNNTQTAINQLENSINLSKAVFKNTIGIPINDEVELTEKLEVSDFKALLVTGMSSFAYENRSEIVLLNTAKKLQEFDVKRQESLNLPTVSAFYQFQRAGQRNPDFVIGDASPWFWYNTGLVGINVSQPIFNGFQRKYKIEQAQLKLIKVDNNLAQVKRVIDMEQNIAQNSLNNALLNLEVQERNTALAQEVFDASKKKYQAGIGSSLEVVQSDTELQRAQGAYFQALFDCHLAKIAYLKSFGKL